MKCFRVAGALLISVWALGCGTKAPASSPAAADKPFGPQPAPLAECPNPSPGDATVAYYACDCGKDAARDCEPGDDGNDGTSPTKPFRSLRKVASTFDGLPAGGMISLCRGGAWDGGLGVANPSCRAEEPCVVRDYGNPSSPAPLINAPHNTFAIALDDPANANHEEGYTFLNLQLRGTGSSTEAGGVFVYNDVDDVLLCGLSITNHYEGVYVGGLNTRDPDSDGKNERTTIRNSYFSRNSGFGFLGGCDGCSIEYSIFDDNGFGEAIFDHNIYVNSSGDHMRVVGNKLYNNAKIDGTCQGVDLVVHGVHDDLLIEGNELTEEPGAGTGNCWRIAVDPGYGGEAEGFTNVVIRGNTVTNVGGFAITVESCQDCLIENNVVINDTRNEVHAIVVPSHDKRDSNDMATTRVTVRNNSVFFGPDARGVGVILGEEGTGHSSLNNSVSYAGKASQCFAYGLAASAYTAIDYNLCNFSGGGSWAGEESLEDLRKNGFDVHAIQADPMYKSVTAPSYDLSPQQGSPLIDAGNPNKNAGAAADIAGKKRDSKPDIGAFEAAP